MIFIWTHFQLKTHHSAELSRKVKDPILTTDFYFTNMEPREWILPTPLTNTDTTTSTTAASDSNFTPEIQPDPVQPGEIRLHSWMLYTQQAPVLDLRG